MKNREYFDPVGGVRNFCDNMGIKAGSFADWTLAILIVAPFVFPIVMAAVCLVGILFGWNVLRWESLK